MQSPFKFLDSYTKEDRHLFFGRDAEIEELYHKIFESKILLVYGISGTGKTSLINCGLANKFNDSDWLPINIRRGSNINESWLKNIERNAITPVKTENLKKAVKSLYLDHFKPVYFIFDQFEELFIFGTKQEKTEVVKNIKILTEADIQCRFLIIMREEYLAGITEFEKEIPLILGNRVRIEKMTPGNAQQAIEGPCRFAGISIEENFSVNLLDKLNINRGEVELTYLQVFLDKVFRTAVSEDKSKIIFTKILLGKLGDVSDILGSFLDEQISSLSDPETALAILKSFVSVKGTKRQNTEEDVNDYCKTNGKNIHQDVLRKQIQFFINIRILRDKDDNGRYELRHDALAAKIYEKITLVEKELMEVRQFIENAYANFLKRNLFLTASDLSYIAPYEDKMFLNTQLSSFINNCKKEIQKVKQRRIRLAIAAVTVLFIVFSGFTFWALRERAKAMELSEIASREKENARKHLLSAQFERERALAESLRSLAKSKEAEILKKKAEEAKILAEIKKNEAINANSIAEHEKLNALKAKEKAENDLYMNVINTLTVSADRVNVVYRGIENPITVAASGIKNENLIIKVISNDETRVSGDSGHYKLFPGFDPVCEIEVQAKVLNNETIVLGKKSFRVKNIPRPIAMFCNKSEGLISPYTVLTDSLTVNIPDFDFDINFQIDSYTFVMKTEFHKQELNIKGSKLTKPIIDYLQTLKSGDEIIFNNIKAIGPDGRRFPLNPIFLKIS